MTPEPRRFTSSSTGPRSFPAARQRHDRAPRAQRQARRTSVAELTISSGSRLGPYEVIAPLGAGGMVEVYRARDTRLERDVAIKVLPERLAGDPAALARFEREAKAVAALSHP